MAEIVIKLVNGELAGKTIQEINKNVRDANKELTKAAVGTEDWVKAHSKLEGAKKLQGDLKAQIDNTTKASNSLKTQFSGILSQIPGFSGLAGAFNQAKGGVGGLTSSFGLLKGAIAATGLGLLVILLGSLVSWFTKTERGGDLLAKVMAALGAAVNVVIDRASKLIDALIAFAKGDWSDAADKFGQATSNVTDEIIKETKAAWDLADALDQLEELEGKLILIRSRAKDQVAELRLLGRDETKSIEERTAAIQKAIGVNR